MLDRGRVLVDGTPRQILSDAGVLARARLRPPQVTQIGQALGLEPVPLSVAELAALMRVEEA